VDHAGVVTELARRFQAGDGAGALQLFHQDIRIKQPASLRTAAGTAVTTA
jgi:hypothetical protein